MSAFNFDDRNISWQKLGDLEHLRFSILDVDEKNNIADVLFKFSANEQIVLHRHLAHNNTFVIQGEHRLYHPNGVIKEIRPVGSLTSSPPSNEPHREGGGDQDVIIAFSIRGSDGVLYELLDDDMNVVATISMQDLIGLYNANR
ncbi:MAG: regulator [Gammaproteobacteria bacterium]|nr:regulator [Gammaproteobacteria bacterium]